MKHFLTVQERNNLKIQHRRERDKRVCDRIKAVLLFDDEWDYKEIAHVLLLSEDSVKQHIQEYQESQKLKPENGGSCGKLNAEQTALLVQHLQYHTYLYEPFAKLETALYDVPAPENALILVNSMAKAIDETISKHNLVPPQVESVSSFAKGSYVKDIVTYVLDIFGVSYTIQGMTDWLHAHKFSYKKPSVVPGKANRAAQEQYLKAYEALKSNLQSDEAICFIDGVHPTHNMKPTWGWILRGERKEIPTNTGRQRLNLSGAIDIISKMVFVREDVTLNSSSTIAFLKDVEAAYPQARKVHIFCDNARYYRNKDVQEYIKSSKIEMHFLPPYSPNLNLY